MRSEEIIPAYITNKQIDKVKWDKCIGSASNGLIYAYSVYLDITSDHWDALVLNDYEIVMPLTWKWKYGIYYLYQPFFAASLGVFGNNLSPQVIRVFLDHIPSKFRYWDIYLNTANNFKIPGFRLSERCNCILDLHQDYAKIFSSFSDNHVRNIKKAQRHGFYIQKDIDPNNVIEVAKIQSKEFSKMEDIEFQKLFSLFTKLKEMGRAVAYGAIDSSGKVISSCIFFYSNKRAYYILAANAPQSRGSGSSHFLINGFIKEHSGKDMILDFEGSDIKSVAQFYKGFGATEETYPALRANRLPGVLRLFKK